MNQKSFPIIIILVAIASFLAGATLTKKLGSNPPSNATTTQNGPTAAPTAATQQAQPTVSIDQVKALFDKGHVAFGDQGKKVLFVEISDPSCPYCHIAAGKNPTLNAQVGARFKLVSDGGTYLAPVLEMKKLVDQGKAGYVWIYYPGHGNGEMAAKALYCANDEKKFWQVHDKLMTAEGYDLINNQVKNDKTKVSLMTTFLQSAISSQQFKTCLSGTKYDLRLQQDTSAATDLRVEGTPMFIVNSTVFPGAYSYADMQPMVSNLLQ